MDIKLLQEVIVRFRDERDWSQFHTIKNLLIALSVECGELQELFVWQVDPPPALVSTQMVQDELADIFIILSYICRHYDIDLEASVLAKIEQNRNKYPVSKSLGSNRKYTEL